MVIWVEILTGWLGAHDLEGYTIRLSRCAYIFYYTWVLSVDVVIVRCHAFTMILILDVVGMAIPNVEPSPAWKRQSCILRPGCVLAFIDHLYS